MEGEAGYLTGIDNETLRPMIEITKGVETGYGSILAISDMESAMRDERIKKTKTVCTYCGVGCGFDVWTKGRDILKVEPQEEAPANGISTCVKGKFGWDFVNSEERLTKPLIREGDRFREAEWEEALSLIASKFTDLKEEFGPDSLAFITSSKCTNEESYLMQKLARGSSAQIMWTTARAIVNLLRLPACSGRSAMAVTQGQLQISRKRILC